MDIPSDSFLLTIVGAIWAAFNVNMTAQERINGVRDVIITGKLNDVNLDSDVRYHMIKSDWIGSAIAVGLTNLGLALVLLIAPVSQWHAHKISGLVCLFCMTLSIIPLTGAIAWAYGGVEDFRIMHRKLKVSEPSDKH